VPTAWTRRWGGGDGPCYDISGVGDDDPGRLKWGPGPWAMWVQQGLVVPPWAASYAAIAQCLKLQAMHFRRGRSRETCGTETCHESPHM